MVSYQNTQSCSFINSSSYSATFQQSSAIGKYLNINVFIDMNLSLFKCDYKYKMWIVHDWRSQSLKLVEKITIFLIYHFKTSCPQIKIDALVEEAY